MPYSKVTIPEKVSQFIHIALCNAIYKALRKVIVNRMKVCMDGVMSPNQTGFIHNRNIHENIVVAQELLHSMNKLKGNKEFFAIKVDLAKAYDKTGSL